MAFEQLYWRGIRDRLQLRAGDRVHGSAVADCFPAEGMADRLLLELVESGAVLIEERSPTHSQAAFACFRAAGIGLGGFHSIKPLAGYWEVPWGYVHNNVEHHWYRLT